MQFPITSSSPHGKDFVKFNHGIDGSDDDGTQHGFWDEIERWHEERQG